MIVTITAIQDAFNDLETDMRSREEIANLAVKAMKADDYGILEMMPVSESERIWEAIKYLQGVDIQTAPNVYLHSKGDFASFRKELGI